MNFRSACFISLKNVTGILIRTALTYTMLWDIAIVIKQILPINEQGMYFYFLMSSLIS